MLNFLKYIFYSKRITYFLGFLVCCFLILFALYLEHYKDLKPCPLCIVQRICIFVFGFICLLAGFIGLNNLGRKFFGILTFFISTLGIVSSTRHVYLQNLSNEEIGNLGECLPSLKLAFDILPFWEFTSLIFNGTGDCVKIQWVFLGLSIPSWCLIVFIGMMFFSLWQFLEKNIEV